MTSGRLDDELRRMSVIAGLYYRRGGWLEEDSAAPAAAAPPHGV